MQKKSLSRQVEDQLYNMIAAGKRFHLGDKLPNENELAGELGVSRATLREAVRSLTVQGILEARQGSGTYIVGKFSGDGSEGFKTIQRMKLHLRELFEMRLVAEPSIAGLAVERASDQELGEILEIGSNLQTLLDTTRLKRPDHYKLWIQMDQAFHKAIVLATHNSVLLHLVPMIDRSINEGVLLAADSRNLQAANAMLDHRLIMEFLGMRDAEGAKNAMALHVLRATTIQHFE